MSDSDTYEAGTNLYIGNGVGGPANGQELISRFAKGVLLVDVEGSRCWVYDWVDGQFFIKPDEVGREERPLDQLRMEETGLLNYEYDVLAYTDPIQFVEEAVVDGN